jgi:adenylosuccinate synthase
VQIHTAIKSIQQKQEQLKLAERNIGTTNTGTGTASKSSKARAKKSNKYEVAGTFAVINLYTAIHVFVDLFLR